MDIQTSQVPFSHPAASRSYQAAQGSMVQVAPERPGKASPIEEESAAIGTFIQDKVTIRAPDSVRYAHMQLADQSLGTILHTKIPPTMNPIPAQTPLHIDVMA
ncbi:MAG: hypothetical protein H7833_03120 [Magnetococcus sp. DMHC-1]|nr:hypothetical protein [Magnetococcales bacterium]